MHYADIYCLLAKRNITQSSIASEADVTPGMVSMVIRGQKTSRRLAKIIARKTGRSINTLWPGKYSRPAHHSGQGSRAVA